MGPLWTRFRDVWEFQVLKDILRHSKHFKSLFEQKIQFEPGSTKPEVVRMLHCQELGTNESFIEKMQKQREEII